MGCCLSKKGPEWINELDDDNDEDVEIFDRSPSFVSKSHSYEAQHDLLSNISYVEFHDELELQEAPRPPPVKSRRVLKISRNRAPLSDIPEVHKF
eukprot:m.342717 g.342717  ORF g.342717 m.342717 type:complete len:95 (-) comp21750_c0_seq1:153-437(-)